MVARFVSRFIQVVLSLLCLNHSGVLRSPVTFCEFSCIAVIGVDLGVDCF